MAVLRREKAPSTIANPAGTRPACQHSHCRVFLHIVPPRPIIRVYNKSLRDRCMPNRLVMLPPPGGPSTRRTHWPSPAGPTPAPCRPRRGCRAEGPPSARPPDLPHTAPPTGSPTTPGTPPWPPSLAACLGAPDANTDSLLCVSRATYVIESSMTGSCVVCGSEATCLNPRSIGGTIPPRLIAVIGYKTCDHGAGRSIGSTFSLPGGPIPPASHVRPPLVSQSRPPASSGVRGGSSAMWWCCSRAT